MATRFRRSRGFRPATSWASVQSTGQTSLAVSTKAIFGGFVSSLGFTIRRIRGLINFASDQQAASESPFGAIGICVVSDDAFAVGATAIPGPWSDADSDLWLMHEFLYTRFVLATAVGFNAPTGHSVDLDSKAMRKVSQDETAVIMVENGNTAHGATFWAGVRMLSSPEAR